MSRNLTSEISRKKDWGDDVNDNLLALDEAVSPVLAEMEDARGTAASLDARLGVAINPDGTLKGAAPATGWWTTEGDAVAYASASTFTVDGDKEAIYTPGRAIYLNQTTDAYGYVASSAHAAGTTTVTVSGCVVDAGLSAIDYGQPADNVNIRELRRQAMMFS